MEAMRRLTFKVYLDSPLRPARLPIDVYEGETLQVAFDMRNADGTPADLTGVDAEYLIARAGSYGAATRYANGTGVTKSGSIITAEFYIGDGLYSGAHDDQLRLTKSGDTVVACAGRFNIRPAIE